MAILSKGQMAMYAIAAGFPDSSLMAEVGYAESGGNTKAENSIGCVGVLQINQPVHVKAHPSWTVAYLQNPLNNFRAGKVLWDADIKAGGDGLGPWADSKNKGNGGGWGSTDAYKKFASGKADNSGSSGILDNLTAPITAPAEAARSALSLVQTAAKWVSNPQSWVHVSYVVVGAVVIVGASFVMVKNSSTGKGIIKTTKAIASKVK